MQGALANLNPRATLKVKWGNRERSPLLLIAGGKDHAVPMGMTRMIASHYTKHGSPVEVKEYPERSHFTAAEKGWEEVADYALDWAIKSAGIEAPAP